MANDDDEEEEGPLLKPLGGEVAPLRTVGEWLVPLVSVVGVKELERGAPCEVGGGGMEGGVMRDWVMEGGVNRDGVFTSAGESGMVRRFSLRH